MYKKKKYTLLKIMIVIFIGYCIFFTSKEWYKYGTEKYKNGFSAAPTEPKDSVVVCNEALYRRQLDSVLVEKTKSEMYNAKLDSLLKFQKADKVKSDTVFISK